MSNLWPVLKKAVSEVHKLSKDPPEEIFGVHARGPGPVEVLFARAAALWVEAQVVLLPLHLIAQHLFLVGKANFTMRLTIDGTCCTFRSAEEAFVTDVYFIGIGQLSKLLFGIRVIWVSVWVVPLRQLNDKHGGTFRNIVLFYYPLLQCVCVCVTW